jgi:hypothetical protein
MVLELIVCSEHCLIKKVKAGTCWQLTRFRRDNAPRHQTLERFVRALAQSLIFRIALP